MKTIIVLGMHRSATSLIAKTLDTEIDMGVKLPNLNEHNPKGHYENYSFVNLNDQILKVAGGSWDNPPPEENILALSENHELTSAIQLGIKMYQKEIWGWKDPRTTLTIELYMPYLVNPHFICCFRSPVEVAKSLSKRHNWDMEKCLRLCFEYNRRLNKFLGKYYSENLN